MKKINLWTISLGIVSLFSCVRTANEKEMIFQQHAPFNPPAYVCYKAPGPIHIDGKLAPGEWDAIPWTSDFVDIEGDKQPVPYLQTRAKMAYDDQGMYFAALLEEPHVWGTLRQHDTVIYQDNDFEIFLNPSNDTHNYLEYEINALGTDWDLYLSKPYRDAGHAILDNWEFAGIKKAVYVDGTINNPTDTDRSWSVEVFIPWNSIYQVMRGKEKPEDGEQIRVNFSRVQWTTTAKDGQYQKVPQKGKQKITEHNWVWAPSGVVNIHLPEYWGFVQFSKQTAGKGEDTFVFNTDENIKWILRQLYYRQHEYKSANGCFAAQVSTLKPQEVCPPELMPLLQLYTTPEMYEITLAAASGKQWHIRQDGLIW